MTRIYGRVINSKEEELNCELGKLNKITAYDKETNFEISERIKRFNKAKERLNNNVRGKDEGIYE